MSHDYVQAPNLPTPVGPYSPAVGFDRLVFVSGQGAIDPATGKLAGDDAATQTEQVLANLRAILVASGSDFQNVLRCGVFLTDMQDFAAMNAVYERTFAGHKPARTTVAVSELPRPGLKVEIDCVAYRP